MSTNTLSAVLEKLLLSLGLADFPCGPGAWRKSTHPDELLDLLSCPLSPWSRDEEWSPQAAALRRLAVLTPQRLRSDFIYKHFTTLSIVGRDVSLVDDGLLKFSNLEELVLSANVISHVPAENLPASLKALELCANRLGSLSGLTSRGSLQLQHLGLSSTGLSSREDLARLTGAHWPQLVSLDLSDCEFQDQRSVLGAVASLPQLRTLMLEGNPFTLAPAYPGLTVDSLPRLACLDASRISHHERLLFKGLAETDAHLMDEVALVTVSIGRMKGLRDQLIRADERVPDLPVVTYSYFITYPFPSDQTPADRQRVSEGESSAAVGKDTQPHSQHVCETVAGTSAATAEEPCCRTAHVSKHSTDKLLWSESLDFSHTETYRVTSLGDLKRFLNRGLCLTLEEEKVLWWPAASEELQPGKEKKVGKEKETPVKPGSTKGKKKRQAQELVQDPPIRRALGTAQVPLEGLVRRRQSVHVVCDFTLLLTDTEETLTTKLLKPSEGKEKEEKVTEVQRKEQVKQRGGRNAASSKGKKNQDVDVTAEGPGSVPQEPLSVELSVELRRWSSASEARQTRGCQT